MSCCTRKLETRNSNSLKNGQRQSIIVHQTTSMCAEEGQHSIGRKFMSLVRKLRFYDICIHLFCFYTVVVCIHCRLLFRNWVVLVPSSIWSSWRMKCFYLCYPIHKTKPNGVKCRRERSWIVSTISCRAPPFCAVKLKVKHDCPCLLSISVAVPAVGRIVFLFWKVLSLPGPNKSVVS